MPLFTSNSPERESNNINTVRHLTEYTERENKVSDFHSLTQMIYLLSYINKTKPL